MVRRTYTFLLLCCTLQILLSQNFVFNPHKFGTNLFAGGIDNPRFQFVDIDSDGDPDLFIFDKDEKLWFYQNINGSYQLEPNGIPNLQIGSWFRFVDIDNDGDKDCFTNGNFSEVSLYTNVGSPNSLQFQLTSPALTDTSGIELFSERFSIPTFADIDGDGDYDFFSGGSNGSITFYKNIGTPVSPQFTFITSEFGGINIQGGGGSFPKALHGASGIEFFDADSNGVLDLFWGDYFNGSLYFLKNKGTLQNPNISLSDSTYPKEDIINTIGFNIPQHVDVDGDGIIDLMVGCVFPTVDRDNFMFYKNVGTNAQSFYQRQTKNYIPMIDVGSRSTVTSADFDGDGDFDLCVGSAEGTIHIFPNTGTQSNPIFSVQSTFSFNIANNFYLVVTSGDLNSDGKPDLLIGSFDGKLRTFYNTSESGIFSFDQQSHPVTAFSVGQNSAPFLIDIDNDGDHDVLVGNSGGQFIILKNIGTNVSPSYVSETTTELIDVGNDAIPVAIDVDTDGILDILIGNNEGTIHHYKRSPETTNKFVLVTKNFQGLSIKTQSASFFVDIDHDGDVDLFLGNGKGGVFYYENDLIASVNKNQNIPTTFVLKQNYPNPFNPLTTISFSIPENSFVLLKIFDVLGREVETLINVNMNSGKHSVVWNATNKTSGSYFCRLDVQFQNSTASKTIIMSFIK